MTARVLVVDDVPVNVKLLEAKLTAEYFEVLTANSGEQALSIIERQLPDVVLLDVMMPVLDGFEVCRRIKANPKTAHLPVVMVTALNDTASRIQGLKAGADDFLSKPANDLILYARVRSLARLKTMMDEWRLRVGTCESFGLLPNHGSEPDAEGPPPRLLLAHSPGPAAERARSVLEGEGHQVTVAANGAEAMAVAANGDGVDVVIIGVPAASEDGLRLCSQLRSQASTRQVPIIMIIEGAEMGLMAKALDIGISDYLVKPLDQNELIARVRTQIRRWRYQRLLREHVTTGLSLAIVDSLTGAYNRRYLDDHLGRLVTQAKKERQPLSLALFDIDHFKSINDDFGHGAGDEVLKVVVQRAAMNLRATDTVARYGGEEFVVIMPGTSEAEGTLAAERLRQRVAADSVTIEGHAASIPVTVSIGVAGLKDDLTPETLLKAADKAMYRAKRGGRNRVERAEPELEPRRVAV